VRGRMERRSSVRQRGTISNDFGAIVEGIVSVTGADRGPQHFVSYRTYKQTIYVDAVLYPCARQYV